jgi:hypothetical protein
MENQIMFQQKLHHCEVSDSFVHPNMKLSNGKNGNGESRLFISCSKQICGKIKEKKNIKIRFEPDYINKLVSFVSEDPNFKKNDCDRVKKWKKNIKDTDGKKIMIQTQNGDTDVNRNYIGQTPHRRKKEKTKEEKINIKNWDTFRKSLVPTKTTLEFSIVKNELIVYVLYNEEHQKYNKPSGCSFVSLEFLNHFRISNNIEIQHAMNGGEHKERKDNGYFWPVDGYHDCEKHKCCGTRDKPCFWNKYVFEFQGDYWHKDKKNKDLAKKEFYIKKGYKWFEITESEYINRKKLIKSINQLS